MDQYCSTPLLQYIQSYIRIPHHFWFLDNLCSQIQLTSYLHSPSRTLCKKASRKRKRYRAAAIFRFPPSNSWLAYVLSSQHRPKMKRLINTKITGCISNALFPCYCCWRGESKNCGLTVELIPGPPKSN